MKEEIVMKIEGCTLPDGYWKKMKTAWDACVDLGIEPPSEVTSFFDCEEPGDIQKVCDLIQRNLVTAWGSISFEEKHREGFEIELSKLPSNITHIRFYNEWF